MSIQLILTGSKPPSLQEQPGCLAKPRQLEPSKYKVQSPQVNLHVSVYTPFYLNEDLH